MIALDVFAHPTRLGRVFGDGIGYLLTCIPHTVRVPDASFVRADRLSATGFKPVRSMYEGDMLDGGAVIPGFACSVAKIFDGIERSSSP